MTHPTPATAGKDASPASLRTNFSSLDDNVLLGMAEVAAVLGVSIHTVKSWKYYPGKEKGPAAIKVGRCVRYPVGDLRRWLANRRKAS